MCDAQQILQYLLLPGIFPCPVRILLEGVAVQVGPDWGRMLAAPRRPLPGIVFTIEKASWILVVPPGATESSTLLQDDKVPAVVPFDQVDRSAQARYAGPDNDHGCFGVVLVAHRDLRPRHVASHCECCCAKMVLYDRETSWRVGDLDQRQWKVKLRSGGHGDKFI